MADDSIVVIFFNKGDYHFEHYDSPGQAKQAVRDMFEHGTLSSAIGVRGQLLWHAIKEEKIVFDKEH